MGLPRVIPTPSPPHQEHSLRMGSQIVIPGGMSRTAPIGGDEDDIRPVGDVEQRCRTAAAGFGASGSEEEDGLSDGQTQTTAGESQQDTIDRREDVDEQPGAQVQCCKTPGRTLPP